MLGVVGSNLKMVKFFMQHSRMLHDVVLVWPGSCNNVAPGHAYLFDFQHPICRNTPQQGGQTRATCCDRFARGCKCWTNNDGICCVEMLRSFYRGFTSTISSLSYTHFNNCTVPSSLRASLLTDCSFQLSIYRQFSLVFACFELSFS